MGEVLRPTWTLSLLAWGTGALLAVGCGRIGFSALSDGPSGQTDATPADAASDAAAPAITSAGNATQGVNAGSGSAVTLSLAPTRAGDLLVVGVSYCCGDASAPIFSDGEGLTWRSAGSAVTDGTDGSDYVAIFYAIDAGGGLTAITVSPGVHLYLSAIASEWENVDTTAPLDGYTSQVVSGTLGDSGPLAPAQPGDLLVAVGDDDAGGSAATAGSGFTLIEPGYFATATQQGIAMESRIDADTAPVDGTLQWTASFVLPVAMAAFRPR